ncbi:hypothetical protein [Hymenobacter negativus]|uniref:DUF1735 domain-containing protein n=1 Tax=Hymenobacter negativus TaxID=2795026 RepID=A0ABS3Q985_9BACT|nr:hypothetical protein [Hymenobacter negativus]MBO2007771.1 hypothetical protein [Hymenobacter negativus]
MNLLRTLNGAALLGLAGTGLGGCIQAPDYSFTPEIDVKEVRKVVVPPAGGNSTSNEITFVLNFRDGDGDLGLSDDDIKTSPYTDPATSAAAARNHTDNTLNYYIQPLKLVGGTFVPYITPPGTFGKFGQYDARFPRLDGTDAKPAPLKGQLNYVFPIFLDGNGTSGSYSPGDVFKFQLTILDRQLHVSNTVTTEAITLTE